MKEEKFLTDKFVTYKELVALLKNIEDYRDRLLIMLVFEGYYPLLEEIQELKLEDFVDGRTKYLKGRNITDCTARLIKKASEEKEIHTYSKFNGGVDKLIESNYLLRERVGYAKRVDIEVNENFNGYAMNRQSIINRFSKIKRKYGFTLSLSSIYGSGVIHRVDISLRDEVVNNVKGVRMLCLRKMGQKDGVKEAMARVYYKEYLKMLPRILEQARKRSNQKENEMEVEE